MSVLRRKLAGDTARFAIDLAFESDPDRGAQSSPEMSASWGSFQVWVDGRNLCDHLEAGERLESVHWYLLPVLEWLAGSWDPLLHEERLPARNAATSAWTSLRETQFPPPSIDHESASLRWEESWFSWWQRHAFQSCREGGLFPDIVIRRWRDCVEISWGSAPIAGTPEGFHFLQPEGVSRQDPRLVAASLFDVLRDAVDYLGQQCPDSGRVRHLSRQVARIRQRNSADKRLMWMAGLGVDIESVRRGWKQVRRWVEGAVRRPETLRDFFAVDTNDLVIFGSCRATLMFGAVSPDIRRNDALELARAMAGLWTGSASEVTPTDLVSAVPTDSDPRRAWEQGYELARSLLKKLASHTATRNWTDVEGLTRSVGVKLGDLELEDSNIRGVSLVGERSRPGIFVNCRSPFNRTEQGRRFTIAHELCHILHDRPSGRRLAIASGPWAPRDVERRANAFAAMLLMPEEAVRAAVSGSPFQIDSVEGVSHVATRMRTGFRATLAHLRNLGYFDEATEQRLSDEALSHTDQIPRV
jgi:Zn-dependent peptidase ImmA (M78 family)